MYLQTVLIRQVYGSKGRGFRSKKLLRSNYPGVALEVTLNRPVMASYLPFLEKPYFEILLYNSMFCFNYLRN